MKFLVDMPLSPDVTRWLRQQGHDALHASQIGLSSASDVEILKRAIQENRIVVTADLDFTRLFALLRIEETGLILFRGANFNEQESIERLERVFELIPNQNLSRAIVVIEKRRIRFRHLPI
jgi:predicted nuclease of predicted toxin-antitoxin system